jgi:hypothetical protein
MNSYELLKKYLKNNDSKFETYTISSFAPNMPDAKAPIFISDKTLLTGEEVFLYN